VKSQKEIENLDRESFIAFRAEKRQCRIKTEVNMSSTPISLETSCRADVEPQAVSEGRHTERRGLRDRTFLDPEELTSFKKRTYSRTRKDQRGIGEGLVASRQKRTINLFATTQLLLKEQRSKKRWVTREGTVRWLRRSGKKGQCRRITE